MVVTGKEFPSSFKLSRPASRDLYHLGVEIGGHPAWGHSTSASVLIEFLIWHFQQCKVIPVRPDITKFSPETRVGGYPHWPDAPDDGQRPSHIRKLAGLRKSQRGLPSEPESR